MQLHVGLAAEPLPENVRPGWIALVIVLAMGVALALLMWSMVRQFRKVDFDEGDDPDPRDGSEAPAADDDADGAGDDRETNGSSRA